MTLSKEQIADKTRFLTHFWIWTRDLHWLAKKYPAWAALAQDLGYRTDWIEKPWPHPDAGRQIRYMEIPKFT